MFLKLLAELAKHPTAFQFMVWLHQHPAILAWLHMHPVIVRLLRIYFGLI